MDLFFTWIEIHSKYFHMFTTEREREKEMNCIQRILLKEHFWHLRRREDREVRKYSTNNKNTWKQREKFYSIKIMDCFGSLRISMHCIVIICEHAVITGSFFRLYPISFSSAFFSVLRTIFCSVKVELSSNFSASKIIRSFLISLLSGSVKMSVTTMA